MREILTGFVAIVGFCIVSYVLGVIMQELGVLENKPPLLVGVSIFGVLYMVTIVCWLIGKALQ